jgi:hypothetical protein
MATKSEKPAAVLQSWVTPDFAREVKELADADGRSVSNFVRNVLEHQLRTSPIIPGEGAARGVMQQKSSEGAPRAADASGGPMKTDEQRLLDAGFVMEARGLGGAELGDLWRRPDEPSRTYWTAEALEELVVSSQLDTGKEKD